MSRIGDPSLRQTAIELASEEAQQTNEERAVALSRKRMRRARIAAAVRREEARNLRALALQKKGLKPLPAPKATSKRHAGDPMSHSGDLAQHKAHEAARHVLRQQEEREQGRRHGQQRDQDGESDEKQQRKQRGPNPLRDQAKGLSGTGLRAAIKPLAGVVEPLPNVIQQIAAKFASDPLAAEESVRDCFFNTCINAVRGLAGDSSHKERFWLDILGAQYDSVKARVDHGAIPPEQMKGLPGVADQLCNISRKDPMPLATRDWQRDVYLMLPLLLLSCERPGTSDQLRTIADRIASTRRIVPGKSATAAFS